MKLGPTTQEEHAVTCVSVKKAKKCRDLDLSDVQALDHANPSSPLPLAPAGAADA